MCSFVSTLKQALESACRLILHCIQVGNHSLPRQQAGPALAQRSQSSVAGRSSDLIDGAWRAVDCESIQRHAAGGSICTRKVLQGMPCWCKPWRRRPPQAAGAVPARPPQRRCPAWPAGCLLWPRHPGAPWRSRWCSATTSCTSSGSTTRAGCPRLPRLPHMVCQSQAQS